MCLSGLVMFIIAVLIVWIIMAFIADIIVPVLLLVVMFITIKKLLTSVGKKKYSEEVEDKD